MKKILLLSIASTWFSVATTIAQTIVGGPINSNTVWDTAGSPYIVQSNVALMTGVILTIDPGVIVKFDGAKSIQFFGTLRAIGTQSQPITFTSGNSSPGPGDWGYMLFNSSSPAYNFSNDSGSVMRYCIVEYAGGANVPFNGVVRINNAFPYLNNCAIQHNSMPAVKAWELSSTLYIDSCTVQYNNVDTGAVYAAGGTLSMKACNISNNNTSIATSDVYSVAGVITKVAVTRIKNCIFNANNSRAIYGCKKGYDAQTDSIVANIITNNLSDGIYYFIPNSSISGKIFFIRNNIITGNSGNGISFSSMYSGSSDDTYTISNNTINNNTGNGIYYDFISSSDTYTITNNNISHNVGNGIYYYYIYSATSSSNTYTITGNTINDNMINGIYSNSYTYYSYFNTYNISNNTINNNSGNGIYWFNFALVHSNIFTITNNIINNNTDNGIYYNYDICGSFSPNYYSNTNNVSNNIISKNQGSGIFFSYYFGGGTFVPNNLTLQKNILVNNNSSQGGGVYIQSQTACIIALTMQQNVIADNTVGGQGGGVYLDIRDDTSNVFSNNTLVNNTASTSSAIYYKGKGRLQANKNTFAYNSTTGTDSLRIVYLKKTQSFNHNNIFNNACTSPVKLWYDDFNGNILNAQNCFWRKNQTADIDSIIWDYFDDQNLAIVDYSNFETLPDTAAPVTLVENVIKTNLGGGNIQFTWSPNLETDLAGYKVYWGSPTGYSFANVINVGNVTTYTLSGVAITDTIAVTAYDTQADGIDDQVEGHESWFSGDYSNPVPTIMQIGSTLTCYPSFSTYQWYDINGPIINANQQQFTPTVSGFYYVIVMDKYGCTSASAPFNFIIVGVNQSAENSSFSIFPNPANSSFTVKVPSGTEQIQILNCLGQIMQRKITDRQTSLNFEIKVNGIYFIQVTTDKQTLIKKIIVTN